MQLRLPRTTTSCSECRRRKQRCNQAQPCSNCARRFPQPVCEYKPTTTRRVGGSDSPITPTDGSNPFRSPVIQDESLDFFNLIQQPLLPVRPPIDEWMDCEPDSTQLWRRQPCSGLQAMDLIKWSGIDILTQFPGVEHREALPWTTSKEPLRRRFIRLCDANCEVHSRPENTVSTLPQARQSTLDIPIDATWDREKTEYLVSWIMALDARSRACDFGPQPREGSSQALSSLSVPLAQQNTELLGVFVKLASRFKSCLDGNNQDAFGRQIDSYVPFCVRTPLLAQVAIYTASCFLVEAGSLDKTVAMAHKGLAIRMLNELLRSASDSTSDEAIMAVIQMILDEWYWGDSSLDLQAHLRGLKEMIRLRGGIHNLGVNGFVGKLAVVVDAVVALSLEKSSFLSLNKGENGMPGGIDNQCKMPYNTPLVACLPPFSACFETIGLQSATATILDDTRFLISMALAMPSSPSPADLNKLLNTASWVNDRVSRLPHALPQYHNLQELGNTQPTTTAPNPSAEPPDFVYQAARQTALIYCRAVATSAPFSAVVGPEDLAELWTIVWRVPLAQWRRVLGVFGWIMVAVAPSACGTPNDRLSKSLFTIWGIQMALDDWAAASGALHGALRLQAWLLLRAGGTSAPAPFGSVGEGSVKLEPDDGNTVCQSL